MGTWKTSRGYLSDEAADIFDDALEQVANIEGEYFSVSNLAAMLARNLPREYFAVSVKDCGASPMKDALNLKTVRPESDDSDAVLQQVLMDIAAIKEPVYDMGSLADLIQFCTLGNLRVTTKKVRPEFPLPSDSLPLWRILEVDKVKYTKEEQSNGE